MQEYKPVAIDLFSGLGGLSDGFHRCGYKIIVANEMNEKIAEIYKKNFQDVNMVVGDIHEKMDEILKIANAQKKIDVVFGGFPCFDGNTEIITEKGMVKIKNIVEGMRVLTHRGRYKKVLKVMSRNYADDMISIKIKGKPDSILCTPEHPILTKKRYKSGRDENNRWKLGKSKFLNAEKLTLNNFVSMPMIRDSEISLPVKYGYFLDNQRNKIKFKISLPFKDEDFWYLIGFYIAEGFRYKKERKVKSKSGDSYYYKPNYRVVFCANNKEKDAIKKKLEKYFKVSVDDNNTCSKLIVINKDLWYFLEDFGGVAYEKKIPEFIHRIDIKFASMVLKGITDGDGSIYKEKLQITTTSYDLQRGLMRLIARVHGCYARSQIVKVKPRKKIGERWINQRPYFIVSFDPKGNPARLRNWYFEKKKNRIWVMIDKIEKIKKEMVVYNLEVQDDNTYCTSYFSVHNCQSFSMSGLRDPSDPRGFLYKQFLHVVEKTRPSFFVGENVKGLLSFKHPREDLDARQMGEFLEASSGLRRYKELKTSRSKRNLSDEESKEMNILETMRSTLMKKQQEFLEPLVDIIQRKCKKMGYTLKIKVLNAADYGVAQSRERAILIGYKEDPGCDVFPEKTHSETSKSRRRSKTLDGIKKKPLKQRVKVGDVLKNLETMDENPEIFHVFTRSSPEFTERIKNTKQGESVFDNYSEAFLRLDPDKVSPTVKGNHGGVFLHPNLDRLLSPREIAKIQSFRDDFKLLGTKSTVLEALGNAVPPKLSLAIAKHLKNIIIEKRSE